MTGSNKWESSYMVYWGTKQTADKIGTTDDQ